MSTHLVTILFDWLLFPAVMRIPLLSSISPRLVRIPPIRRKLNWSRIRMSQWRSKKRIRRNKKRMRTRRAITASSSKRRSSHPSCQPQQHQKGKSQKSRYLTKFWTSVLSNLYRPHTHRQTKFPHNYIVMLMIIVLAKRIHGRFPPSSRSKLAKKNYSSLFPIDH